MKVELRNAWGYQGNNMNLPVGEPRGGHPILRNGNGFSGSVAERLAAPVGNPGEGRHPDGPRRKRRRPGAGRLRF